MATRNFTNKKQENMVSTKKTYRVNGIQRKPPPATNHEQDNHQPTPSSNPVKEPSSSTVGQNGLKNHQPPQNFSSRNSLRTAKTFSTHPQQNFASFTMPNIGNFNDGCVVSFNTPLDLDNYSLLTSDCFLRHDGSHLVCMLCGKRERMTASSYDSHLETDFHQDKYKTLRSFLFNQVPDDSSLQMNALRELINIWYIQQAATNEMIDTRIYVMQEFGAILNRVAPECYYRVLGSMMSGTPLVDSDINLELIHPNSSIFQSDTRSKKSIHHRLIDPNAEIGSQINNHTVHYDLIPNAIDTLHKVMNAISNNYQGSPTSSFRVVSDLADLNSKVPKLSLLHEQSATLLQVCCYAESSHKLAVLLRKYLSLDERATILSVLVKHWAKLCSINNPDQGTYPPDVYTVLVIYFLQRTTPPVLPCLHELITRNSRSDTRSDRLEEVLTKQFKKLNTKADKHLRIDTNASNMQAKDLKENILDNPPETMEDVTEGELEDEEEDEDYINMESDIIKSINWHSSNDLPVYKLFLKFLYTMYEEFKNTRTVISIRTLKEVSLTSKRYITQVKAIEHPIRPGSNMSSSLGSPRIFDYIKQCFVQSFQYLICLPINSQIKAKTKRTGYFDPNDFTDLYFNVRRLNDYYSMKKDSIVTRCRYNAVSEMINQNLFAKDVETLNILFRKASQESFNPAMLPGFVARSYNNQCMLPKGSSAVIFCWLCKQTGHTRKSCRLCKTESLTAAFESYDINLDLAADLDSYFLRLYFQDTITPEISLQHSQIVKQLETLINTSTGLGCRLELFGSTVNSLGSADSDLDICLTLEGNPSGREVNCAEVLDRVHSILIQDKQISSVEPILGARVPIIKFKYLDFDVDLSMYNLCAIYNSKLLKAYAVIDNRVAQLFYLVKRFAKACQIADASRGCLSSYAWSLLVIHYLQQTNPPTLPVLQETPNGTPKPTFGVNGWNVWFDENYICPQAPLNQMTLTQLLKGFFLYYATFDFNYYVVSIRKKQRLTRFQKNWNNCTMAIEDPFELTYNLASRLDEPMAIYIMNSFVYEFRNIVEVQRECLNYTINSGFRFDLCGKIFNSQYITNSVPPFKGCRICHKIGHRHKDCPERNNSRNKGNNSRLRNKDNMKFAS